MIDFETFKQQAEQYRLVPVFDTLPADLDTPVSALLKIKTDEYDFLFESVVGGERWARYSFLGTQPRRLYKFSQGELSVIEGGRVYKRSFKRSPLEVLRSDFAGITVYQHPELPRFFGGVVGYFGYPLVSYFEDIASHPAGPDVPDLFLMMTDTVVIFDNLFQVMKIVSCVWVDPHRCDEAALRALYDEACAKIESIKTKLKCSLPHTEAASPLPEGRATCSVSQEEFCARVERAKEYIRSGDIFQVVLSLQYALEVPAGLARAAKALTIYRALRRINPSPYMYYLCLKDLCVVGSSPEVLVRLEDDEIHVRPIAGTRPRGNNPTEDDRLAKELQQDPKESSEHTMLVDLGRNDVGRVAKTGTVRLDQHAVIERYSHVMHLVSHISGKKSRDKDVFDVIEAAFPAGTLTGAPKVRAMEIIHELEGAGRGIYGGAVGYVSFTRNADLAIAIRTAVLEKDLVRVQAGAGIVFDSVAQSEYEECVNKAKALMMAVKE